jgi:hypothetical protein
MIMTSEHCSIGFETWRSVTFSTTNLTKTDLEPPDLRPTTNRLGTASIFFNVRLAGHDKLIAGARNVKADNKYIHTLCELHTLYEPLKS